MTRPEKISSVITDTQPIYAHERIGTYGDFTRIAFLETIAQGLRRSLPETAPTLSVAFRNVSMEPDYLSPDAVRAFIRTAENRGGPSSLPPEVVRAFDKMIDRITADFSNRADIPAKDGHDAIVTHLDVFNASLRKSYVGRFQPPLSLTPFGIKTFAALTATDVRRRAALRVLDMSLDAA